MRGRTNITPVKNPYVKGDLVQAVVETGNTIETGDFVEVVYDSDSTYMYDGSLGRANQTSSSSYARQHNNGQLLEFNGGFLWYHYINEEPKLSYVKIENDSVVVKSTLSITYSSKMLNYFGIIDTNLVALLVRTSDTQMNLLTYKIENNSFVQVATLSGIAITSNFQYSVCKLSSTQLVIIGTQLYTSQATQSYAVKYILVNYTSTTLTLANAQQELTTTKYVMANYSYFDNTIRMIYLENNKFAFVYKNTIKVIKVDPSDSTKLVEDRNNNIDNNTSYGSVTFGLPKLLSSNKIITISNDDTIYSYGTNYTKVWISNLNDNPITKSEIAVIADSDYGVPAEAGTSGYYGKTIEIVGENTFMLSYWDSTYSKIYIVRGVYNPGSDTITFSNKVSFTPNFIRNSGTPKGGLSCFGYFFYSGGNYYYVYTDNGLQNQDCSIYYKKLKYENGVLSIGQATNRVRSYSGNGFVLGFAKTGGNAGDTITVYKPHSNS